MSITNNPSGYLPHHTQTWSEKSRTGKSGHTQMAAAIYTSEGNLSSLYQIRKETLYPELHRQHVQGHFLYILIQLMHNSPTPIYFCKVEFHAGIAKHQAIQGDDTPADTTFPCVNLEGNPFHDTTWLAFEEAACFHAGTSERPNSHAQKLKHFPNLHDALKMHMPSKHRLINTNTEKGYYSRHQGLLPTAHKKVSNTFWTTLTPLYKME
eukprot:1141135-Pelagomonas_calceolata.AAC.3